jgi:hypothetical protein
MLPKSFLAARKDTTKLSPTVRGQEHISNGIRAGRGFFIVSVQVLVLCSRQELVPLAAESSPAT